MRQGDVKGHRRVLLLAVATMAAAWISVSSAQAAERSLDPVLSLIGGCSGQVEALDPVEDPGCPGGTHPPSGVFVEPRAVTTDFYGNIYVSSWGSLKNGSEGRIDIFDPDGFFISEVKVTAPSSLAVDSKGNLYVVVEVAGAPTELKVKRYAPTLYEPAAGNIGYSGPTATLAQPGFAGLSIYTGIAVNPANDHLFANYSSEGLLEYSSAEEGNTVFRRTALPTYPYGVGVAVDAARGRVYVTSEGLKIDIFDLNQVIGTPPNEEYKKIGTIDASGVPGGKFGGKLSVAVDEGTGHVFVLDGESNKVFEFTEDGAYLATIEHGFAVAPGAEIGIDNGPFSPNGTLGEHGHYLYVPSGKTGTGHSFAFEESNVRPPEVKTTVVTGTTESEVELQASINPGNLDTSYTFEYITEEDFLEEGFASSTVAGSGQLPAGNLDAEASAVAVGLEAGIRYRFRVLISNEEGSDEMEGSFATYPSPPIEPTTCGNQMLRIRLSALLPDCRAYELVTPADTNARAPLGVGHEGGWFTTHQVAPTGDKLPFRVEGGSLPGVGGTGSYLGDPYLSSRSPGGWSTAYIGPTAAEATTVMPGGTSPDQGYSFWNAEGAGSATTPKRSTSYLRYPDGHSELLGKGSIGTDIEVLGMRISEGGEHVIFGTGYGASTDTAVQLEPDAAPPTEVEVEEEIEGEMKKVIKLFGTPALYDKTPSGLRVVSLLPGDQPLAAGERAVYMGSSLDGEGVVFEVGTTIYLRYQDEETYEIGDGVVYAGIAEGGSRVFYLEGGRLWRFDAATGERTPFSSGTVAPVNISADGSAAYFSSTAKLPAGSNPLGAGPKAGKQNLYLSREGTLSFVGTVTERDVVGKYNGKEQIDGLGLWTEAASSPTSGRFGIDPSRTTPEGGVLLFQSRAPLTGYDSDEHAEVFRYDFAGERLECLSCSPIGAAETADATLQSEEREGFALFFPQAWLANLRSDGRRAIFQSSEALVPADTDGLQDVYEWEEEGVGSCTHAGGCLYLISSGHSSRNDYLWAVSESGDDVFFLSSDLLVPSDLDETPSIYDARVGGGFAEASSADCQGEGCRPQMTPPPPLPGVQTPVQGAGDNFKPRRCGKGKRKVKRGGKVRCVKKHRGDRHHKAGSEKKGARK